MIMTATEYDQRHGGAFDRGSADAYYRRPFRPHYFLGGTMNSPEITEEFMTDQQIEAYTAGYREREEYGDFKDWG